MAGMSVFTGATVRNDEQSSSAETDVRSAATGWRQFCRAQPELAGLAIGALLSAPLVMAAVLNT
jgi:hypothetical protein